jgi:hypothetical protein
MWCAAQGQSGAIALISTTDIPTAANVPSTVLRIPVQVSSMLQLDVRKCIVKRKSSESLRALMLLKTSFSINLSLGLVWSLGIVVAWNTSHGKCMSLGKCLSLGKVDLSNEGFTCECKDSSERRGIDLKAALI